MANRLIIYNSDQTGAQASGAQIMAANIFLYRYRDCTIKDIKSTTSSNIDTWIGTLTDNYYTDIFVCSSIATTATNNQMSQDQIALLDTKLIAASKGSVHAVVRANSCQTNAVATNIILDSGASASDNYYNGMYIVTAGTTVKSRYIADYTGSSKTCDVVTTTTAITNTETYIIYTLTNIHLVGNVDSTTGKTAAYQAWEICYPTTEVPVAVQYIGGYLFALQHGTASAAGAGTLTLATTVSTGDSLTQTEYDTAGWLDDAYVYIYSSTLGAAQVRKISSWGGNAGSYVATLESNWDVTPTGTIVYRVVQDAGKFNADKAMDIAIRTYMADPTKVVARQIFEKICDNDGGLAAGYAPVTPGQDLQYLQGDLLYRTRSTNVSDVLGVV